MMSASMRFTLAVMNAVVGSLAMAVVDFRLIPFPEAVTELNLVDHFRDRTFRQYYESADKAFARIEADSTLLTSLEERNPKWRETIRKRYPMRYVRYYSGDGLIEGDIDIDELFYQD